MNNIRFFIITLSFFLIQDVSSSDLKRKMVLDFLEIIKSKEINCKILKNSNLFFIKDNNCEDYVSTMKMMKQTLSQCDELNVYFYSELIGNEKSLVRFDIEVEDLVNENVLVALCKIDGGNNFFYFLVDETVILSYILMTKDGIATNWIFL